MPASEEILGLAGRFLASVARWPDRPAVAVAGAETELSYAELASRAGKIAATLRSGRERAHAPDGPAPPLTAVLVERGICGFAAILGALISGHAYLPISPALPAARIRWMLDRVGARELVVDRQGAARLPGLFAEDPEGALAGLELILAPETDELDPLPTVSTAGRDAPAEAKAPPCVETAASVAAHTPLLEAPEVALDDMAYLLFTSGSTGEPKGVMVSQGNIEHFLGVVTRRYGLYERDRVSQLFELTFDLSLFDLFAAWSVGACVCVPDAGGRLLPARWARDAALSVWFSVPSVASLMKQTRQLVPDALPGLRLALFCGEALPAGLAAEFAAACPDAAIENIYGPTELTLACTHHRFCGAGDADEHGVVPIGVPFAGMSALVVDPELRPVAPGEVGELLVAGPQVALGYWRDPERSAAAFLVPPSPEARGMLHYRTGDRVRRPTVPEGPLTFQGRVDAQIKVHGHRVELGEIEAALREVTGIDAVAALGWPPTPSGAGGIEAFVAAPADRPPDPAAVLDALAALLPRYMLPRRLHLLEALPLNNNGKIDRHALRERLAASS